jgi:hypothetical protein
MQKAGGFTYLVNSVLGMLSQDKKKVLVGSSDLFMNYPTVITCGLKVSVLTSAFNSCKMLYKPKFVRFT